ncbi:hypothetical protein MLD38_002131 [Melastoma candidum]|uniref:Uncharacterized protein n=1 Tax=Melastoma candidum TaxID=119954 RepID=A0ACB9SGS5_9MYRT|nr:hypothetical protein MLD38_002131 [Melastoma candidum]
MAVTRADVRDSSSDRQKWRKVFETLVQTINKQQSQLEGLVKERSLLEDRLMFQHKRWESDVGSLKDQIFQMKGKLKLREMVKSFDLAKLDLALATKEKESLLHKLKLEHAGEELNDLKNCLEILSQKYPDSKNNEETNQESTSDGGFCRIPMLEDQVKRLRLEYDRLIEESNSRVSALLTEKKFVWNQYKILETDLCNKLKRKCEDVDLANEKISNVLASLEELQTRNVEKDDEIAKLKKKVVEMEDILGKKNDQVGRLTLELDTLRKSMATPPTRCASIRKGSVNVNRPGEVKKEPAASQCLFPKNSAKGGGRSSKRKDVTVICLDTPKLFSSSFKVPKLKDSVVR